MFRRARPASLRIRQRLSRRDERTPRRIRCDGCVVLEPGGDRAMGTGCPVEGSIADRVDDLQAVR